MACFFDYSSRLLGDGKANDFFDFCYYFLRAAARVKDLFHLPDPTPLAGAPNLSNIALAFLLTVMCLSLALFAFFRLFAGGPAYRILIYIVGVAALFVVPVQLGALIASETQLSSGSLPSILFSSLGVLIGLVSLTSRVETLPFPSALALSLLFPGIAAGVLFRTTEIETSQSAVDYLSWAYAGLAIAAVAWIASSSRRRKPEDLNVQISERVPLGYPTTIGAGAACAILIFLWAPGRNYSLLNAKDRDSTKIELHRTACFGSCPAYTVTVHGDGQVDYLGQMSVKECGKRSDSISKGQVTDIFRELDRAHFFALEDRAFLSVPDVPSASVTVWADGKTKRVWGVTYGAVPRNGALAAFARATSRIDEIVGSAKWIYPKNSCEHRDSRPPAN
jgi:hypothetical protein